ncbi:ABC transporter ATP-binding protein [Streptomyces sp. NBC_00620]|uniref:ABC transporter ATP-binding protein n=1 Tax=unclassified Streptomyces TaxID=2593676 RepID=UPI00224F31A0|nr:ABC transporter ATP-binding protein [Streptomyces sp. NBC_00620]MCX4977907.1 ABC transporter ATP-binding protein/permease [Streptomyces sp. NBC_00620]WUC15829.1 ABC transporter ATP-binding protein/permease [Streptomyces sp. NBC_00564]
MTENSTAVDRPSMSTGTPVDRPITPAAEPDAPTGTLAALIGYARPHWRVLLLSLVLTLLASVSGLAQPKFAQTILDRLDKGADVGAPVALLAAFLAAGALLTGVNAWLQQRTSERVVRQVRRGLVHRLIRLRVSELDQRAPGDLIARVTSDSTLLKSAATEGLIMTVNGVLTFAGTLIMMATLDARLLGVTMLVLVLVGIVITMILPRIKAAVARSQTSVGAVGAVLDRTLGAARTVKANGAEGRETRAAEEAVDEAYAAGLVGARYSALIAMVGGASIQTAFLVVLGVGGAFVANGTMSVSELIAFLLYVFFLAIPVSQLVGGAAQLQQGLGAVGRIQEAAGLPVEDDIDSPALTGSGPAPYIGSAAATTSGPAPDTDSPSATVSGPPPDIELTEVEFTYPGRAPALRGVSFTVPGGTQTALVGLSGAGKTTLFSLLQRFYEPTAGTIRIGGQDISTLPRGEVRRRIAYVEQDSPVMSGTLRENLLYAAPSATAEQLAEALAVTRLDGLVARLPMGLDTAVGPRGVTLSGGERQRLAIARALLRRPQVLLLDEATAQLDARNEQALSELIGRTAGQCTVLLIAHRLSTVTEADQIVVLEHGDVRAIGTHHSLVDDDELYRELASTQLLAAEPRP